MTSRHRSDTARVTGPVPSSPDPNLKSRNSWFSDHVKYHINIKKSCVNPYVLSAYSRSPSLFLGGKKRLPRKKQVLNGIIVRMKLLCSSAIILLFCLLLLEKENVLDFSWTKGTCGQLRNYGFAHGGDPPTLGQIRFPDSPHVPVSKMGPDRIHSSTRPVRCTRGRKR